MHTIKVKITKKNFGQRVDSVVLKEYQTTKAKYDKLFRNKVDTAKYIEELLIDLTLEMDSALSLAIDSNYATCLNKKSRNPLDTIKSLQSDLENPNWN